MTKAPWLAHKGRQVGTLAGLVLLSGLLSILSPYFLSVSNLLNVLDQIDSPLNERGESQRVFSLMAVINRNE